MILAGIITLMNTLNTLNMLNTLSVHRNQTTTAKFHKTDASNRMDEAQREQEELYVQRLEANKRQYEEYLSRKGI